MKTSQSTKTSIKHKQVFIFHWQYSNTKWGLSADDDEYEWKDDWEQHILDQNCLTFNLLV